MNRQAKRRLPYARIINYFLIISLLFTGIFFWHYKTIKADEIKSLQSKWQQGYNVGHEDGLAEVGPRLEGSEAQRREIQGKYDDLVNRVNNYNSQRNTSIRCSSNNLGYSTYTTCY